MRRHPFPVGVVLSVAALAVTGLGLPLVDAADPAQRVVRVGFVGPASPSTTERGVAGFWERLRDLGWVEGQNLVIETRWAEGRYDRLPALMNEVVSHEVDVLVTYSTPGGIAAKKATSTIPIVVAVSSDPVRTGLVQSLAHPGGNLTGMSLGWTEGFGGKWLGLLQETISRLSTVAVITNPDNPIDRDLVKELEAITPMRGMKVRIIEVRGPRGLARAFEQAGRTAQAVLVLPDPIMLANAKQITALAARYRLPGMYSARDFVYVGGLMEYAPDLAVQYRHAAEYVDKILRGAKPGDLPIQQPTKFEFVVNLKTAKALGLTIPESVLLQADEVIR